MNFEYNKETGNFFWKFSKAGRQLDKPCGHKGHRGYIQIKYNGQLYLAHRLAFLYMTGIWPEEMVGFKDNTPSNCSWDNLYLKTKTKHYDGVKEIIRNQEEPSKQHKEHIGQLVHPVRRARFTNAQVSHAVAEFIKDRVLVEGVYVRTESSQTPM